MPLDKVSRIINDELNSIIEETREYKSFALGLAYGNYSLYKNAVREFGVDQAKKCFSGFLEGADKTSEYFRKLIREDDAVDEESGAAFKKYANLTHKI